MLQFGLSIVIGYVIGAVPFGMLVARATGISDIRGHGSGNIGATNVVRVAGWKVGVWVYLLDVGKGAAAVLIAMQFEQQIVTRDVFLLCCGFAAVLGHIYPVYLGFKGGKGVSAALGVMLVLLPVESLIAIAVFVILLASTRFVSLGSIVAAFAFALVILIEKVFLHRPIADTYLYVGIALALLVAYTHRENIKRLISGTESKFTLSSRAGEPS